MFACRRGVGALVRFVTTVAVGGLVTVFAMACGSRTGIDGLVPGEPPQRVSHSLRDAGLELDAGSAGDAPERLDSTPDNPVVHDAGITCPDGAPPVAYLFDMGGALWRFEPDTLAVLRIGVPACGDTSLPWTLSVSRDGKAYLLYSDWAIFEVELDTLACKRTPFRIGQLGMKSDIAIAISRNEGAEKLFVYGEAVDGGVPILAASDLTSFVMTEVGDVLPPPPVASFPLDMQGDARGRLYGFAEDGVLLEIDSASGAITQEVQAEKTSGLNSWAVMTYEDQVFLFTDTAVALYDVSTQIATVRGDIGVTVVGASAAPCLRAP